MAASSGGGGGAGGVEADENEADVVFAEALSADEVEARKRAQAEAAGEVVELLDEAPETAAEKAKREAQARQRQADAAAAAAARLRTALRAKTDWHTGNGTKQTVEAEVQKAVDAVLQSAQLPASLLVARLRWQSQKYIRSGGYGGYTMNPKTKRYEWHGPAMTEAHAYSVTLQPPSAAAPPLSDGQKANAAAALGAIALLPGIQGVKSRGACPTDADVASLLARHALGGCLAGTLRFPCGDGDDGASRVVDAWRLPARTHDEAQLRALLHAPSSAVIRFSEGRTRAEVTYASAGEAAQALKHINAAADCEKDAAAAAQLPRAKLCAWTREPHAPRDGGWRAKLVLSAAADGAAGSSAAGDDAPRMARLHASTEGRVAALLWDAAHAHGIDEVDTSALVLVRAEERCEVAQPDWRAVRPRPPPPAAAGSLDLRFRPDFSAARSHEALLGGPVPPPEPDARALSAAATAAASAGAAVLVAHRRRTTTESRYEPYRDVFKAIVDVGRFTQSESKTASWVTMHVADETMPDSLGPCLAVGRASGGRSSACVWGALHACGAVPGRDGIPALAFATLRVTGARAATGELTVRADIGIAVTAAAELPRCRATEAAGDALALLLRHVAATRPLMAPPPATAPPPPPPAAAAGFCGVVGCAAHRASAGAALEAAAADCFSLERLYADSVNPAADTDASALPVPRGLTATLQPFQRSTLAWALQREAPPAQLQLHPLVRGVTLAGDTPLFWDDGRSLAAGSDDHRFGTEPPVGPPLDICGGIIAEEMGMGKTLEVIALMLATKGTLPTVTTDKDGSYLLSEDDIGDAAQAVAVALGQRRSGRRRGAAAAATAVQHRITPSAATLVVVPRPLLMQWQAELERHTARGALRVHVFSKGDAATSATLAKADVVLTTFDALASQPEWADAGGRAPSALLCTHWLRVVVDEAHALRNVAGSAARFCGALLAERRWAISGTPIPAKLQDLYGLMCFLRVDPYCNTSAWTTGIVRAVEAQAEHGRDALTALLRLVCMRHTKAVVALPPRTLSHVSIALEPAEAAAYASLAARQRRPAFRAALDSRRNGVLASYVLALRLAASGLPHRYDDTPVEAAAETARVAAMAAGAAPELSDAIAATWRREAGCCASCGGATASPAAVPRCSHLMCGACADGLLEAAAANGQPSAPCPCCAAPFDEESLLQLPLAASPADGDDEDDDADAAAGAKVAHLLAALAAMPPGARALVFSQFAPLLRRVAAALKGAGVRFVRFDGSCNAAKRDAALAEWRADSGVRALLLDTRLAACGLTLTEATRVFILDVPTSAGMLEQAAARAHRLGQTQPVTVQVLVAAGTIEARLALRHGRKLGGDGAGALRGADARALAQKHMEWLLTDAPLRDDSDSDDDGGASAAAPGDVQVAADVLAAAQAAAKGKGPKPAVKLEHGGGVVSMLSDDEEDDATAAAPVAKKARKQTRGTPDARRRSSHQVLAPGAYCRPRGALRSARTRRMSTASPDVATARLAAFSAALRLAVPAEHELTLDPELHALYAPAVVAALDAALGDGAVAGGANALVDLGPYRELDQGGRVPFFLVPDNLTYLAFHDCAGLRHALRQYGGDPNIRYEVYDFPSLYSFTPLHAVVRYMARVADGTHALRVDAAALARALLDAGAEPDARCEIVARYSSDEGAGRSPYTGPRFGATAAIMLAAPAPGAGFEDTTGPVSLAMLEELFRRGARLDVKAGNGKSIREHRRLTPQARELLDRIAAERKAETRCCWMARG